MEIQILSFPSAVTLEAFLNDRRRQPLPGEQNRAIATAEIIEVELNTASRTALRRTTSGMTGRSSGPQAHSHAYAPPAG